MYGKLKTHNFFVTTLDAVINDTDVTGTIVIADKTVNGVTLEDGNYIFWMLVGLNSPTELEIFRIVSVSGKILTYDKRISPNGIMPHSIGDLAQCNDMGELINFIGDNTQMFGYTETISGVGNELKVNVLGGTVMDITMTDIIVPDVILTMVDNSTNYIYLDDYTNTIKTTTVNPVSYYTISTVVTLNGAITSITDTRVVYTGKMGIPLSITEAARDAIVSPRNGSIIFNDTTGTLNRYEGGQRKDFSFGGISTPRLSETVEGKARYSTNAEYAAQMDTGLDGAPLVPKVSQVTTTVGFASTTVAGTVEEATLAEIGTATATGGTGARLFINPSNVKKTSAGASDENKIPILGSTGKLASGFLPVVQLPYDAVVATSGGDYTTITAAIAAGKRNILIRAGNYTEDGWRNGTMSNFTVIGEGVVNITFNNTSGGTSYIAMLGHQYYRGLNFTVSLNGTNKTFLGTDTGVGYYNTNTIMDNCSVDITTNTTSTYLVNSYNNVLLNNCSINLNNSGGNTIFLSDDRRNKFSGCSISGYVGTIKGTFESCFVSILTITFASSKLSSCTFDGFTSISGTIYYTTNSYFSSGTISGTGSVEVYVMSNSRVLLDGDIDTKLAGQITGCYLFTRGDITFGSGGNKCNVSGCTIISTVGTYSIGSDSCTIVGNLIQYGTAFSFGYSYNVINGNCFTDKSYTFTIDGGVDNIVTSNNGIGSITDTGSGNVKANNI